MTAYELTYALAAFIIFYKAVQNLIIFRRNQKLEFLLYFGLTQLSFSIFLIVALKTINAPDTNRALLFERLENACLPILAIFFMLFTHKFRQVFPDWFIRLFIILNIVFSIFILLHPGAYHAGLLAPKTFPALGITIYETEQPVWVVLFLSLSVIVLLRVLIKYFLEDTLHLTSSRAFVFSLLAFGITLVNDSLTSLQIINMPYTAHFGFVILMFSIESLFKIEIKYTPVDEEESQENQTIPAVIEENETPRKPATAARDRRESTPDISLESSSGKIRINVLGSMQIFSGEKQIPASLVANKRKLLKLFKLLILKFGKGIHREEAISTLWPEMSEANAINNLHALCFRLRKIFPQRAIVFTEDRLYLEPDLIETDFQIFENFAAKGLDLYQRNKKEEAFEYLQKAVSLYRGDFFEFDLYFEGADPVRHHLQRIFKKSALALCEISKAKNEGESLIDYSSRAIRSDDLDEEAWRALFTGLKMTGRKNEALRKYEELKKLLKTELDVEPDERTESLIQAIKSGSEK